MIINKKSQTWGMDLIIGIMIFSFALLIFFIYALNNAADKSEDIDKMKYDGDGMINQLYSAGYPINWNISTVISIGVIDDNKINQTKLDLFYNLSIYNYTRTKRLFNTKFDYLLTFENITANNININGIGKSGINESTLTVNATNLVLIKRLIIYKLKPTVLKLYIWE
jgi:hypothetical protein